MPTGSDSRAAIRARDEAELWRRVAGAWWAAAKPEIWAEETPPVERLVIPEADPSRDLHRRGEAWGVSFESEDLAGLSRFAAALAVAEADSWQADDASVATRAYSDRRFLFADRILPWAVPWLRAVVDSDSPASADAKATCDDLLELGEHHRPAPDLAPGEGLHLPGHDGYGLEREPVAVRDRIGSLWGGLVRLKPSEAVERRPGSLAAEYARAASGWEDLAEMFPGSAGYWRDLAVRARHTARVLAGG